MHQRGFVYKYTYALGRKCTYCSLQWRRHGININVVMLSAKIESGGGRHIHAYIHIRLLHSMTERICTRLKYK